MLALIHREPARRSIFATDNTEFIIQANDYERLAQRNWYSDHNESTVYAVTSIRDDLGKWYCVGLHSIVLGRPLGGGVRAGVGHHKDGDGRHNWHSNLELVSNRLNILLGQLRSNNSSGIMGVFWDVRDSKWRAQIRTRQGRKCLGSYICKEDAIRVRLAALAQEIAIERARCASGLFS